jgi:hypothetical protein
MCLHYGQTLVNCLWHKELDDLNLCLYDGGYRAGLYNTMIYAILFKIEQNFVSNGGLAIAFY